MTSDALARLRWFNRNADRIREEADHDAAKFEALIDDPALEQEALTLFPDKPLLYPMLKEYLYPERLLARRGVFFIDLPPTENEHSEFQNREHETRVECERSQREKDTEDEF